jgi:hypothetical protein
MTQYQSIDSIPAELVHPSDNQRNGGLGMGEQSARGPAAGTPLEVQCHKGWNDNAALVFT